ncbi:tRNA(adenine(34)) deaminase, partial [Sarracenia purpurea var. burkii]
MYNTYITSTLSLRCKGSLSFSVDDYSYLLNDRFDRNPRTLTSQSCCSCCSNSVYRVSINPSFLHGLKQSALIQWSASRRLMLGGRDRYYSRFLASEVGRSCCCGLLCPLNERISGRRFRPGEGNSRCTLGEKSDMHSSRDIDDAELMLSFLTEELGEEECFGFRERNVRSSRSMRLEKGSSGSGSGSGTSYRNKKKNDSSGLLESSLKRESVTIKSREEDNRRKEDPREEDKENHLRGEKCRVRKEGSSCSSYYSFSSLGEVESDTEIQVIQEGYKGESASGFKRNSEESGEKAIYDGQTVTVEEVQKHRDVECDWRKKSEKKLTEGWIEETQSLEKSSNKHPRISEAGKTGYTKPSIPHQKFHDGENKTAFAGSVDNETRQQYNQKDDQLIEHSESRMKYKHFTGAQEIHDGDIEAFSSSKKHVSGRDENLRAAGSLTIHEHSKTAGRVSQKDEYIINSQPLNQVLKIQEINDRRTSTSQRQSQARVMEGENKSTVILSSGQTELGRKTQQLNEISDTPYIDIDNTSASLRRSDSRMENQEGNPNFVFGLSEETKEQHFHTGQQAIRKTESRKGSQDPSNLSVAHSSDAQVIDTRRASERGISNQETYAANFVQKTEENIERHDLSEGRVFQIGSRKETTQRPNKSLSISEGTINEASGSQSSLIVRTQLEDKNQSQAIVMAPPSQLEARGRLRVEPICDPAIQVVSGACLESGSDALRMHAELNAPVLRHEMYGGSKRGETHEGNLNIISHEDALGSAEQLQKSSTHFVGEFLEKATHEISISKVQNELEEGRKHQQKNSSQNSSGYFKSKEHDSRRSSRSSGVKGPSDEIWDVTAPSIQQSAGAEAPESTSPTTKTIAKRTGRSLWNIISDIIQLRWTSRSQSHNSVLKTGGRSSPNQSASTEAWFSGLEPDENSDENGKREKESMSHSSTSGDQQQLVTIPTGNQGEEGSSLTSSKDEIGHVGVDATFHSGIRPASKGISSVQFEENFGRSSNVMVESSVSMPSLRMRRSPNIDEISEAGKTDEPASASLVQEQPSGTSLREVSGAEGKDGELKRRKLERSKQVLKDRFDEWEEVYALESEQRKIDEMFMREALLEAKKAADIWEVPVGAVLVQHGKIIARGCNLVEDLRDSTAHAEMICIREASNILRTWRLSETTLYVTLEPCPMCAGAMLQARIDTVVWGAPNKLLGADGSWI